MAIETANDLLVSDADHGGPWHAGEDEDEDYIQIDDEEEIFFKPDDDFPVMIVLHLLETTGHVGTNEWYVQPRNWFRAYD